MAATSSIRVALDDELPAVGAVGSRAGFGPRVLDQLRFLRRRELGEVFVADAVGRPVGAAACIAFEGTGWIGAVGVVPEARSQGIGGALTEAAVDWLHQAGADPILLQATALGRPVYERLGFLAEGEYVMLSGPALPGDRRAPHGVRAGRAEDLPAVIELDRAATGEDRSRLLETVWPSGALVAEHAGVLDGFHVTSGAGPGGAIVATSTEAGVRLIDGARSIFAPGEHMTPVPHANRPARHALRERGYRDATRTTRMRLGPPVPWNQRAIYSAFNLFWG
ncbi:MAG: GNAT family N-acetyltransferase [Thermoleophilaceae bacterium]